MIKRLATLGLVLTMVLYAMTGCSKPKTANVNEKTDKLKIVTTIFPPYDFVREIGQDKVDVTMLLKPGAEAHSYEPTPADIKTIQNADLLIYTGGENDVWVDDILSTIDNKDLKLLKLVDCVQTVEEEVVEGMEHEHHDHDDADEHHDHDDADEHHDHNDADEHHDHDDADGHHDHDDADEHHDHDDADEHHDHDDADEHHDHDHDDADGHHDHDDADEHHDHDDADGHHEHHHEMDEHVWTSPKNDILIVEAIRDMMKTLDSANSGFYDENAAKYIEKLSKLDNDFIKMVSSSKLKTIVVADRFPFRYLADAYGLKYYAAFTGCSTETEANPSTIAFLIDKVKEEGIKTVFTIEMSDGKLADSVCDATGATKEMLHSAHNLSQREIDSGLTFIKLMQDNLDKLSKALN